MKVVLFSDAPISEDGGGIHQTLYNVFSFIEPEDFLAIAPVENLRILKPASRYVDRYIGYRYQWMKGPNNRLSIWIEPVAQIINYIILKVSHIKKSEIRFNYLIPTS